MLEPLSKFDIKVYQNLRKFETWMNTIVDRLNVVSEFMNSVELVEPEDPKEAEKAKKEAEKAEKQAAKNAEKAKKEAEKAEKQAAKDAPPEGGFDV